MSYLFAAFSVVWMGLFLYLWYLTRRVAQVEGELKALEELFAERKQRQGR